jgi:NAD(P)-dependent dehydrogenase (short-subunit alcohol dehydrogenase family)
VVAVVERLKGHPLFAHVTLTRSERSPIAALVTEMLENVPQKVLDRIRAQIPLGRFCRPEEIARVVHFLAADASAYITGQVWGVNGGLEI